MNDTQSEDVDDLLERFRDWLEAAQLEAGGLDQPGNGRSPEPAPVAPADASGARAEFGLIDLAEEFTALRHELKLQTKSGRGLLEQAEAMLAGMRQAIEQFRSVEPKETQAAWSAGKPLAEALGDLDEALDRGRLQIEKARRRIADESTEALTDALDREFRRQSWLRRRLAGGYHRRALDVIRDAGRSRREFFDSLLEGYQLIQNRLGRLMKSERIERIPCEGNPVNPERMVVLEIVEDSGRPPGTVVKELRRGYTWKNRLLRYAEVQAASTTVVPTPAPADELDNPYPDDELDESGLAGGDLEDIDGENEDEDEDEDDSDTGIDLEIDTGSDRKASRPASDGSDPVKESQNG